MPPKTLEYSWTGNAKSREQALTGILAFDARFGGCGRSCVLLYTYDFQRKKYTAPALPREEKMFLGPIIAHMP